MEEELGLVGGATADDTEAELIRNICEMELLDGKKNCCVTTPLEIAYPQPRVVLPIGKQVLAAFVPLLLKVCNNPGLYSNPDLSAAASLALGKFCMIR
jgi:condensin complex subunit 1